jgi:RNA polymerase sigma factor (sigma-70 family)
MLSPASTTTHNTAPSAPITILIVDDHAVVREGLRAMLEGEGSIEVVGEAINGLDGLEMASKVLPRVVLMDISMPVMDGLEATARIKREHPSVTVIMLTMYSTESHVIQAIRAGASGYLLKDAPRAQVLETIRAAGAGEVLISADLLRGAVNYLVNPKAATSEDAARNNHDLIENLTPRENEVLALVAQGKTNKEIAKRLGVSAETVKKMVQSVIGKLQASDRTHAAVKALRAGLLS